MSAPPPLLVGEAAERARRAGHDIVGALAEATMRRGAGSPFLAGGAAGAAVVLATWAHATGDDTAVAGSERATELAMDGASDVALNGDLYSGVLGVGWALAHLERLSATFDAEETERDDEVLADKLLLARPWPGVHDLTRGLVGIGIHALELWPGAAAQRRLAAVVGCLAESSRPAGAGALWWTDPSTVMPERAAEFPAGYVDLGVAHGQAGVVALLAVAASLGIDEARPLAAAAADYLMSWRQPDGSAGGRYPSLVVPGKDGGGSRLAWCYGDPGVAWALLVAGRSLDSDELVDEARSTALGAARRSPHNAGVSDAGLCHGALGVAHVFLRLGRALEDSELLDAARTWIDRGLDLRRDSATGVAGFFAHTPGADATMREVASPGLLEGAGGVALALLAATSEADADTGWDRFLMPQRITA